MLKAHSHRRVNEKALDKTPPAADEYQAALQLWYHRFNLLFRALGEREMHSPADTAVSVKRDDLCI